MNSIPTDLERLGLDITDYTRIAYSVQRIAELSRDERLSILDRATAELPAEVSVIGRRIPKAMCNDREFFEAAGLNYADGPPVHGCFTAAVADHLLKVQHRIVVRTI